MTTLSSSTSSVSKLLLLFALIVCVSTFSICQAFAQWQWLNPKPSGYNNNKIIFINRSTGFILNSNGDLYKTIDTGKTWTLKQNFPNAVCMDIKDSTGVIAGWQGSLYVSSDNGTSWNQITTGYTAAFNNVSIGSRDTFFLSVRSQYSNPTYVYKTNDRGKTFNTFDCTIPVYLLYFINSKIGFAGGENSKIMKTEDGGLSWQQKYRINSYPTPVLSMQFLGTDTGYALSEDDSLLFSKDGGNTWKSSYTSISFNGEAPMHFVNTQDGYFAAQDGLIYATHDGGKTFTSESSQYLYDGYDINSVYFLSKDTGFIAGNYGRIAKTVDECKTWVQHAITYLPFFAISFGTDSTGFAITGSNLFKTTNKGQGWDQLDFKNSGNFNQKAFKQVHFFNADTGFIISTNPVWIHNTFNGGISWDTINPTYPNGYDEVYDMQFLDKKIGFINLYSSGGSAILKTTNSGRNWATIYKGIYFKKIFYLNEKVGYASRCEVLYKTTDSSKTWTPVFTGSYSFDITGISFSTNAKGIISTSSGGIITTNDGGNTWNGSSFYIPSDINVMKFFNGAVGYLCAGNTFMPTVSGFTYKTLDSGATWQLQTNVGGSFINFSPDGYVVITGSGGEILTSKVSEVVLANQSIKLSGSYNNNKVLLDWNSTSIENGYFIIERSVNGVDFKEIGNVVTKPGYNSTTYKFNDVALPLPETKNIFYRILFIDKENKRVYSNAFLINLPEKKSSFTVFPNPAKSIVIVNFGQNISGGTVYIINGNGRKVLINNLGTQLLNSIQINISGLSNGVYSILFESNKDIYKARLLIVK